MMSRRRLRGRRTDRLIGDEGLTRVLVGTLARSRSILGQPGLTWSDLVFYQVGVRGFEPRTSAV